MLRASGAFALSVLLIGAASAQSMDERYGSSAIVGGAEIAAAAFDPRPVAEQSDTLSYDPAMAGRLSLSAVPILHDGEKAQFRGALSFAMPIEGGWLGQVDGVVATDGVDTAYGAAVRGFVRNSDFTVGATAAFVSPRSGDGVLAVGPEAQLHLGQGAIEAWGGVAVEQGGGNAEGFAMLDLAFYPHEDWRLAVGGAVVGGETSTRLSSEYLLTGLGLPLALTADVRFSQDGNARGMLGITGYIGGSAETVAGRDRQDLMRNRALDLANSLPRSAPAPIGPGAQPPVAEEPELPGLEEPEPPIVEPEPLECPPGFFEGPDGVCIPFPVPL